MIDHKGWIGVDLDGTLAHYDKWRGVEHIGEPVPLMVERVKEWLAGGADVRIFTARVSPEACALNGTFPTVITEGIQRWCEKHIGRKLAVTCHKDMGMVQLWDDRAVQVIPNTGERADGQA